MSAGGISPAAAVGRGERLAVRRDHANRSAAARIAGFAALASTVCASVWVAAGASQDRYLLQLPTRARPRWIEGPLHGLGSLVGPSGPSSVSVALIVLLGAYLLALTCARSIPLRVALGAVVLANLAFALGPTIVSSDVFGYIAYAREAARAVNPYLFAPSSIAHDGILQFVYWKRETSPYGPLFTAISAPLGLTGAAVAYWVYKALAGIAAVASAYLVAELARRRGFSQVRAMIFVGLNPVLLVYAVSGAHNDLLAVLLVTCAVALVLGGRDALGAGAAVAAASIKLTLGLALPFVLVGARHRRSALRGAAVALALIGVPTLLLTGTHFLDQLHRIVSDPRFDIRFSGPDRLATLLGTHINGLVRTIGNVAAATVVAAMVIRALRGADFVAAAGWALLALIASIASLAPWYLVWVLPLAAIGRSRPLRAATILATVYLLAVHLPVLGRQPWLSSPAAVKVPRQR